MIRPHHCLLSICLFFTACSETPGEKAAGENTKQKKPKIHLVKTAPVILSKTGLSQTHTGSLRSHKEVKIYNQEEGKIISLPYYESDQVKKGQVIAKLDDNLLRAQLSRVKANLRKAESELTRIKSLRKESFLSEEELINVETELALAKADETILKTRLSYANIAAPFNGVISQRLSEVGNIAERFTHLLTLSDPSSLITQVNVSGLLLNHIKLGDIAQIQIDALGKQQYAGTVRRIHPTLNPITRRGTIEIEVSPVPKGARAGQLCRVEIKTQATERLLIPLFALRRDPEGEYVYIVDDDLIAKKVLVTSGLQIDQNVEILSGLKPGQQVIVKGFLSLKSGKKVKLVNQAKHNNEVKRESHEQ